VETKRRPRTRQLFIIFESLLSLNVLENVPGIKAISAESAERANAERRIVVARDEFSGRLFLNQFRLPMRRENGAR
jgi:hypothetical protein